MWSILGSFVIGLVALYFASPNPRFGEKNDPTMVVGVATISLAELFSGRQLHVTDLLSSSSMGSKPG